ncbi:MAG: hypothetical protein ACLU2L_01315 [Fenollaria timonensis]
MKRSNILFNILIVITSLFLIYKVYSYIDVKRQEKESVDIYKKIEDIGLKRTKDADEDPGDAYNGADENDDDAKKVDFDALESISKDIVSWIESDEGSIDYPVVKGKNNTYYLYHAVTGQRNLVGSIFMDYRNESMADPMIMIYGHVVKNGTMFASLHEFKKNPAETGFTIYNKEQDFKPLVLAARSGRDDINQRITRLLKKEKNLQLS